MVAKARHTEYWFEDQPSDGSVAPGLGVQPLERRSSRRRLARAPRLLTMAEAVAGPVGWNARGAASESFGYTQTVDDCRIPFAERWAWQWII